MKIELDIYSTAELRALSTFANALADARTADETLKRAEYDRGGLSPLAGTVGVAYAAEADLPDAAQDAKVYTQPAHDQAPAASVARPRGKPMPGSGRARRTKEEIAEDEAAQAAEDAVKAAGQDTGAIVADKRIEAGISTGEDRVDPENPEDAAADAADEAAETAQAKAASGGKLTLDDVRNALGVYVQKFGLDAAQADGPKVLKLVCGDSVEKISAIPDDQTLIGKVVSGIEEMTTKNPFKREAVAAKAA